MNKNEGEEEDSIVLYFNGLFGIRARKGGGRENRACSRLFECAVRTCGSEEHLARTEIYEPTKREGE